MEVPNGTPAPPTQKLPPPVIVNGAAAALTVNVAVLLVVVFTLQPDAFKILLIVKVVEPPPVSKVPGIINVPFEAPIVRTAVLPEDALAPLSVKVTVYVPAPSVVLLTVAVEFTPAQTFVAVGDVKFEMLGFAFTLNAAVLPELTVEEHPPVEIEVIVTVVEPAEASRPAGIVNVPLVAPIVNVAVLPEEEFAPVRL
ncbi:MAG: hypothetical protein KF775_19640 [Cyclobacteriaceae bacterium]|nr:hypothetical protein [Cyclobacteriaceae bacterium]